MAVTILPIDESNAEEAAEILVEAIGENFIDADGVMELPISLVAVEDGKLVGVGLAEVVPFEEVPILFPEDQEYLADELPFEEGETIGYLSALGVRAEAQGRGIGSLLVRERIERLHEQGADHLLAFAWKSEAKGCHVGPLLEREGMRPFCEIERFWEQDSQISEHNCPYCTEGCFCSCVIYLG